MHDIPFLSNLSIAMCTFLLVFRSGLPLLVHQQRVVEEQKVQQGPHYGAEPRPAAVRWCAAPSHPLGVPVVRVDRALPGREFCRAEAATRIGALRFPGAGQSMCSMGNCGMYQPPLIRNNRTWPKRLTLFSLQ